MSHYLGQDRQARAGRRQAVQLTGRGAVLGMLAVFGLGLMMSDWVGATVIAGLAFVAGSAAAARYTKPAALLTVAVSPPLLFCCALVVVQAVTATGNMLLAVSAGCLLTLAALAPWLFGGVALSLAIGMVRGLPQAFRDLRSGPRPGHPPRRQPTRPRPTTFPNQPPGPR